MKPSQVYFLDLRRTVHYNLPELLNCLLDAANFDVLPLKGAFTAVKVHFGEPGNQGFLRPNFAAVICDRVKRRGGLPFVTDSNTLYVGGRRNALEHLASAYANGYNPLTLNGTQVIIADGLRGLDERKVPVENGRYVTCAKIGSAIMDADAVISLNHFKCHELNGIGGALKNLGMGSGSRAGKMEMHSSGKPHVDPAKCVGCGRCRRNCAVLAPELDSGKAVIDHAKCVGCGRCIGVCPADAIQPDYDEAAAVMSCKISEYAKAVVHGRPSFHVSAVIDVAPFCDCHDFSDRPIVADLGLLASADPVALDQACADLVLAQKPAPGSLLEQRGAHPGDDYFALVSPGVDWRAGLRHAESIKLGSTSYELVEVR